MIPTIGPIAGARLTFRTDQKRVLVHVGFDPEGRPGIWIGHVESDDTDVFAMQVIVVPTLPGYRFLVRQPPISLPKV